jgi:hypothetical protein
MFYTPPDSDPNAPVATSRDFPPPATTTPQVGAVWGLGETKRTVVR